MAPHLLRWIASAIPSLSCTNAPLAQPPNRSEPQRRDRDPEGLAAVIRLRVLALYGVQSSAGVGPSRLIAAMAAAVTPLGAATVIGNTSHDIAVFLRPRRVSALPGVGAATARTLTRYGINTIGDIADTPLATLQRILDIAAGRHTAPRPEVDISYPAKALDAPAIPSASPTRCGTTVFPPAQIGTPP